MVVADRRENMSVGNYTIDRVISTPHLGCNRVIINKHTQHFGCIRKYMRIHIMYECVRAHFL